MVEAAVFSLTTRRTLPSCRSAMCDVKLSKLHQLYSEIKLKVSHGNSKRFIRKVLLSKSIIR